MKIRVPSKKVCERFYLIYELKGAQKGVDVLTEYYRIPKMKLVLDGRKVMKGYPCDYFEDIACFTKKGLNKRNVLHELYHHIIESRGLEMSLRKEEKEANRFVMEFEKK
ncbi:hypothetical protein KAU88_03580 [Candidatus Bathyarchaeota archaeon]|nr:hypothetical protein [Candidatus Bathyarchaeota archaeon]